MNKNISIIITLALVVALGIIFLGGGSKQNNPSGADSGKNIAMRNGIQYITISAGGGYSPLVTSAKAGIPTKLIVQTNGSYDCSSSLAIHSIGFQKILPQTGETEIDIDTKKAGETLTGVCGMGMYSFVINFS